MKRNTLIICTLIISLFYSAITNEALAKGFKADIKGTVIEKSNGDPLAYATVTILTQENKIVAGATTDDKGNFKVVTPVSGSYKVRISFIGFKEIEVTLEAGNDPVDMGKLELEVDNKTLAAAVVTAKIPLIEQKLDKVVMNVSQSIMATTSNGYDIIKKAPGVSIDQDGNVKLNGQEVAIWIDGRPSNMTGSQLESILSALDGNTIEKIEIMQHPSSKFDASGSGGIINIKTKKKFVKGVYGSINANSIALPDRNRYDGAKGSVDLNYRSKNANTYINYSGSFIPRYTIMKTDNNYGNNFDTRQLSNSYFQGHSNSHYVKAGSDIYLNDKNTIGFLASVNSDILTNSANDSWIETYKNGVKTLYSKSIIEQPNSYKGFDANLYYTRTFSETSDLTFNLDYGYYDIGGKGYQSNSYYNPTTLIYSNALKTQQEQYVNIYSAKVDYKHSFFKKGTIEAGAKFVRSATDNDMVQKDSLNGIFVNNNNMSSKFKYEESVAAGYFSISYQISPKFSAVAGLRAEYTKSNGNWISADTVTTNNYIDLFPTVYMGYTPNKNWRLSVSYTRRLNRPSFYHLNPFREYMDANSVMVGDPNITPQYSHNLNISAGFKSFLTLSAIYMKTKDHIMQDATIDQNTGTKTIIWKNYGSITLAGASLSITEFPIIKEVLFYDLNASLFSLNTKSNKNSTTEAVNNTQLMTQLSTGLTAVLPKGFKIETNANYIRGMRIGNLKLEPMLIVYAGIKKSMLNNKLTLSLSMDDIFKGYGPNVKFTTSDTKYKLRQNQCKQKITLGVRYMFGNVKQKGRTNNKRDDTSTRVGK